MGYGIWEVGTAEKVFDYMILILITLRLFSGIKFDLVNTLEGGDWW